MCHPKSGDVLLGLDHRVFPGLCLRTRLRTRGHVLDLYGRLPGSGTGCYPAGTSGAPEAGSGAASPLARAVKTAQLDLREDEQTSFPGVSRPDEQHGQGRRVELSGSAFSLTRRRACQNRGGGQRQDENLRQRYGKVKGIVRQRPEHSAMQQPASAAVRPSDATPGSGSALCCINKETGAGPVSRTSNSVGSQGSRSCRRAISPTSFLRSLPQPAVGGGVTTSPKSTQIPQRKLPGICYRSGNYLR